MKQDAWIERYLGRPVRLFLYVLIMLMAASATFAQDPYAGKLTSYESAAPADVVRIMRLGYSSLLTGKPGDALFVGDIVKTGDGVKARIELSDATTILLAPNSSVQIKGHQVDREAGKRNSVMKTLKGTIRFVVAKLFRPAPQAAETSWKESQVTIETVNMIAGVRGTDFFVITDTNESEVAVLDGAVSVRSATLSQKGDVMLGANQFTMVRKGGNPTEPSALGPERIERLTNETSQKNPKTSANGNGAAKKPAAYTEKDMERDLASGVTLHEALDRAVERGMTIEQAVVAALNAGAAPVAVVYTAIAEGYPANQVVQAAVGNGAPLTIVLSSAIGAGADKKLVITGATDAGVPPPAVASAMAAISSGTANGNGALPLPATPSFVIPQPGPSIGGGGGAVPSTRPASPYRP